MVSEYCTERLDTYRKLDGVAILPDDRHLPACDDGTDDTDGHTHAIDVPPDLRGLDTLVHSITQMLRRFQGVLRLLAAVYYLAHHRHLSTAVPRRPGLRYRSVHGHAALYALEDHPTSPNMTSSSLAKPSEDTRLVGCDSPPSPPADSARPSASPYSCHRQRQCSVPD